MIRQGKQSDLHELSKIFTVSYNSINIGEKWTPDKAYILLKHLMDSQPDLFFVVEEDGKLVGAITAETKPWWDGIHLVEGELFLHPASQKKGLGKQLVKKLFEEAKKKYNAVSWDTFTHRVHEHPLKWYKSMSFSEIKEWVMISGDIKKVLKNLEGK